MNGTIPNFYNGHESEIPKGFFETPNPYKSNIASVKYNLRQAGKYAYSIGKSISDLSWDEMQQFRV